MKLSEVNKSRGERIARMLDDFEARRRDVAVALVRTMRREIPEYGALLGRGDPGDPAGTASEAFAREVALHALEHVDAFARSARSGLAPEGHELDFVRIRGEQRARELLPLDALLQAYLLGQRTFWEALVSAADGSAEDLEALVELTGSTFRYTHAIAAAVAETYAMARQRTVADRDRARRDLIDVLLARSGPLSEELVRRATQLGLEPSAPVYVAVAVARPAADGNGAGRPGAEALRRVAEALGWHGSPDPAAAFVVVRHDEVVTLIPAGRPSPEQARKALQRAAVHLGRAHGIQLLAGVSTSCEGLGEVERGHREAHLALRHATGGARSAVALDDVGLLAHLTATADPSSRRLVPAPVRQLAGERALVETLRAYAASDLNVAAAARALDVHPNTVHYRLGRVQEIAERDPRRFSDLSELLTGLTLAESARSPA
jgi:sugar diacid utilization regulator